MKKNSFFACVAIALLCMTSLAYAENPQTAASVEIGSKEIATKIETAGDTISTGYISGIKQLTDTLTQQNNEKEAADRRAATQRDPRVTESLKAIIGASPTAELFVNTIMDFRVKQLNAVPLASPSAKDLIVDATQVNSDKTRNRVSEQQFSIFMRLFCDPKSRAGTLEGKIFHAGKDSVGCGRLPAPAVSTLKTRASYATGANPDIDKTGYADEILSLPLNPAALFFEPRTYPIIKTPSTPNPLLAALVPPGSDTNVNPLADLIFPGIMQSIEFLTGAPDDLPDASNLNDLTGQSDYLRRQASNTRKSIASYVFAVLAGERLGTMGPDTAQNLAKLLKESAGEAADTDPIATRISILEKQPNLSIAEFMNIMMYEIPTSPGYLQKVNKMDYPVLQREKIMLMGMQSAVNYQRNHWMEILASLEATRVQQQQK